MATELTPCATLRRVTTTFVAGGTGFIGEAFVKHMIAAGHRVRVVSRSRESAEKVASMGAEVVEGDLLVPGPWQDAARTADHVVHLAQPQAFGGRVSRKRAEAYRVGRELMDRNLLDVLDPKVVKRVVYVSGTSYYGNLGLELRDESATPVPRGWGPYVAGAIDALRRDLDRGLPVVTAFPGYVYGDGSWFREYILAPLARGQRINTISGRSRFGSPIHVDDCACAIAHLFDHGVVGERYFVVDDRPIQWSGFYEKAAATMKAEVKLRRIPVFLLRLLVGPIVTDSILSDAVLSNAKLKALGFTHRFPTIDEGVPDVIARMRRIRGT
jgi:nucleoside-diphosphate-sugar epimerase